MANELENTVEKVAKNDYTALQTYCNILYVLDPDTIYGKEVLRGRRRDGSKPTSAQVRNLNEDPNTPPPGCPRCVPMDGPMDGVGNRGNEASKPDFGMVVCAHQHLEMETCFDRDVDICDAGLVIVLKPMDLDLVKLNQLLVNTRAQVPRSISRTVQADDRLGTVAMGVDDVLNDLVERETVN